MKLIDRRKRTFLKELERHGILARAARAASPRARRALEGYLELIYGGPYREQIVG